MKKLKLVLIEWEDSVLGFQGWKIIGNQDMKATRFYSVGFVVKRNKKCTVLYPHIEKTKDKDRSGAGDIIIPNSAIIKETKINL